MELLTSISSPQKLKEILKNTVPEETDNHKSTTSGYILPHTFRRFVQRRHELVQKLELFGTQWCITPPTLDLKSYLKSIQLNAYQGKKNNDSLFCSFMYTSDSIPDFDIVHN